MGAIHRLVLSPSLRSQILVHLLECAPNEGVGLLGVHPGPDTDGQTSLIAANYIAGRNTAASPTRFTMDPRDVLMALRTFREQGLILGAVVHSHLQGPPTPSTTDITEWHYPNALMLITSFAQQPPSMQAWRIVPDDDLIRVQPVQINTSTTN